MCELTFAVTTSQKESHKALSPKPYSEERLSATKISWWKHGRIKTKNIKNIYVYWPNSVRHIYNTSINTFGKGYRVQQRRLNRRGTENLQRKRTFLTASLFTSEITPQTVCNIGRSQKNARYIQLGILYIKRKNI
jgi:superfamily I DNA and/or RNA helicase